MSAHACTTALARRLRAPRSRAHSNSDAGKVQKKGHAGNAVEYVGRTRAVKDLQVSLRDFRKLCVLKGIYPRDPRSKKRLDSHQTYYHYKDISYLRHEPLLKKFRETKAFMKKLKRAIGRNEMDEARRMYAGRPVYTLDHLVKERFPRFEDALGDLDDPLSLVHLFAALPAVEPVKPEHTATSKRLAREWSYYIARSHALRKVFLTIKGVYFSAEVKGVTVTWLVPWSFAQTPPADVDYRVMLTFLELAEVLMRFTQYKLYHDIGLAYPPRIRAAAEDGGAHLAALDVAPVGDRAAAAARSSAPAYSAAAALALPDGGVSVIPEAVRLRMANTVALREVMKQIAGAGGAEDAGAVVVGGAAASGPQSARGKGKKSSLGAGAGGAPLPPLPTSMYDFVDAQEAEEDEEMGGDLATFAAEDEGARKQLASGKALRSFQRLFRGLVFFLGREVPREVFELLICAFAGRVGWDGPGSPYEAADPRITHAVVDRPVMTSPLVEGREYVQPQWVADSVNARMLLPVARYAPGAVLPPHLSPFVDDAAAGYVPAYRVELERLRAAASVTGALADVLSAAEAEAAGAPKDAAGRVNRLGTGKEGEEEEEEESDEEDEEDEGEEELDDAGEEELDDAGEEEEDDDEEDVEELLRAGAAPPSKRPRPSEAAAPSRAAKSLAAAEEERRSLAASMLTGNKRKAYDSGRAKQAIAAGAVAALQSKAAKAKAAGDGGVGKSVGAAAPVPAAKAGKRSRGDMRS